MKYVIHNVGEYYRPSIWKDPVLTDGWVKEYNDLSDMPESDRLRFQYMIDNDEVITNSGNMVWQIRTRG